MVPNGWFTYKFSEIVKETQLGTTERHKGEFCSDPIPLLKMGNLSWGGFNLKSLETLPRSRVDESLILKKGDFLFNTRNTPELVGKSAVWNGELTEAIFDNNINRIVFHNSIDPFYLGLYLNNGRGKSVINSLPAGSTSVAAIYWKDLKNIKLTLPPLPEQRKIAKILSTWDKAVATTEKLIATSQQQKKALMQQLLTGKKRLVNPDTGKVFEGDWEEVRVANFGKVVTGNTPPKGDDSNYGSDISWATAEDFKGKYVGNTKVKLTKSGVSKARLVPKGSVLVTCIASIGKNAIADEDLTTNQQINAVIVNSKHCNEFFYYQIEFNKHKLLAWAGTTAVPILNKSSFEKILLLAPLKHEQQKIASVLTAADKEIELLETKLAHLKNEKKALMQQLLTGKRRVKVEAMEMA
ncbi:restriction endonuclease subunit S [Proteus mirabilis]|uniref:restriction endonuclease subunit S n=1 Tax=Proteus mirabilis TaxID=584 RepID=UPI0023623AAC|nr:restriction endonuclease subunit S [Proteus mirabilis]MDC9754213.1 restriction endonuclease subunit S [Proteus mirabilis]